jgi:hypothetical protein
MSHKLRLGCRQLTGVLRPHWEGVTAMKSFPLFAAICAVALSAEATKTANAITITETINFTASGFSPFALVDPVIGRALTARPLLRKDGVPVDPSPMVGRK